MPAGYTIEINGISYAIAPGTFVEGSVRRQAEFQQLDENNLKSRPDTREWLQTSWTGGADWAKPIYSESNLNTYYKAAGLSLTDTAGAVQQSQTITESDLLLGDPSPEFVSWQQDGVEGVIAMMWTGTAWRWGKWDSAASKFISFTADYTTLTSSDKVMASAGGPSGTAYALMSNGYIVEVTVATGAIRILNINAAPLNGTNIWVDADYVWIYNCDKITRWTITALTGETIVDDGDGPDEFASAAVFTGKPVIPEWSCSRAIQTSEGIFYVKNMYQGGLPVCKVYRVDRDSSGTYINTPLTTLSPGIVGIDLAYHESSLLISTVSNLYTAVENTDDQRVTIYHVTGGSVGTIGSPLGGDNLDETPVWFLGAVGEQYFYGGRKRIWQYDPRVGAFHQLYEATATKYTNHGSGFCDMAYVKLAGGTGSIFKHASQDGVAAGPYAIMTNEATSTNTNSKNSYIESNWFDFRLPTEQKAVSEIYWDSAFIRASSTVTVQVMVDGGAWATVKTLTGGTTADTGRSAITSITGYKFRYKLIFSDDTDVSSADPGRMLAVGFTAMAGEMVEVMQFTIDGRESMNIENSVQDPKDVYDNINTLRANTASFTTKHYYYTDNPADSKSKTMKVVSITGNKDWPGEGMYDVVLMQANA